MPSNRREAILAASTLLFAEKGFGSTTTSEIAREASVAEGTLYHHFASKNDIFLTLFDETINEYLAGANDAAVSGSGRDRLAAFIRFHFDYLAKHQPRLLILQRDIPPDLVAPGGVGRPAFVLDKLARTTELLAMILDVGKRDGTLRFGFATRDGAELLRGILSGCTRQKVLGGITMPTAKLAGLVESFCMEALATPRPGEEIEETGGFR
ncbi:MAG TPA: TetR/AcrR family transcriptional regulator [Candidatus Deferrimicrobiaceae bacterium]